MNLSPPPTRELVKPCLMELIVCRAVNVTKQVNNFKNILPSTTMKICLMISVTSKKSPNLYKSCPKMISLEKMKDFNTFTKIA